MGPAILFLTSLRAVAKQNQLVRFRMASSAAAVNVIIFPTQSLTDFAFANQFGLKDPSLIRTQGLINGKWVDGGEGGKITVTSSALPLSSSSALQLTVSFRRTQILLIMQSSEQSRK